MVEQTASALDLVFGALAHPVRREILRQLAMCERNLTELAESFRMSFQAVSKHVKVLERASLVRREVVGRAHVCRAVDAPVGEAARWIEEYTRNCERTYAQLDDVLEELKAARRRSNT